MAHDFEVDGVYYNIISSTNKTVEVTYGGQYPQSIGYRGRVTIPSTVTYDGTTYSVISIGNEAFKYCTSLKELCIEDGIETLSLGYNYYSYYNNLGEGLFYDCPLETLYLGRNIAYSSGRNVGYSPFYSSTVKSVIISNCVTSIPSKTFAECKAIEKVEFNCDSIDDWFSSKTSIKEIVIGNSVTSIGDSAFYDCSNLTNIVIPNSVISVGNYAFDGTSWYKNLPDGIVYIGNVLYKYKGTLLEDTSIVVKDGTSGFSDYAFVDCTGLKSIEIPNSVTRIGSYTFSNCTGLTSIKIPDSITSVGNSAFSGCVNIESIYISSSIESIGNQAFAGCNNIFEITMGARKVIECSEDVFSNTAYNNAMLYVPAGRKSFYEKVLPWSNFIIEEMPTPEYTVTYMVDGEFYKIQSIKYGDAIPLIDIPVKEGHTFSGWSEAPATMPASDITIEGTFTVNSYMVKYVVDGEEFATDSIAFGSEITLREEPTKRGHTFSGWSEAPATMPASDITIEGTFTVNSYVVKYLVDGEEFATDSIALGSKITLREEPTKEGHTFSGWSEAPATMPASDITIEGTFTVNSYMVKYVVDGEEFATDSITFGAEIVLREQPTKEGHTFSGWSEVPATMPAENITITGSFAVNYYTIIYIVDGGVYKTVSIEYGAEILVEDEPTKDGYTFSGWSEAPETMPAEDIIITGSFILNVVDVISIVLDKSSIVLNVGDEVTLIATITPDNATDKSVIWYTSNPFVATVEDGVVTAVGEGDAVITALAGNKVAICIVKVLKNDTAIDSVNGDNVTKEVIYDLNGNRIVDAKNLNNGIYIINGKKVLVK